MSLYPHPVVVLLQDLGDSPKAIAQKLESEGVRGVRFLGCSCALARYLEKHGHPASVDYYQVKLLNEPESWSTSTVLEQFARNFDQGLYPSLIEESGEAA